MFVCLLYWKLEHVLDGYYGVSTSCNAGVALKRELEGKATEMRNLSFDMSILQRGFQSEMVLGAWGIIVSSLF